MSADGRHVVFGIVENLVPEDTNKLEDGRDRNDAYVYDLDTGVLELISVATGGIQPANSGGLEGPISADGQIVLFDSWGTFVDDDTNDDRDCYLRNRLTNETSRISVTSSGAQLDGGATCIFMTPDARFILLQTGDPGLVANDTNDQTDVFIVDRQTNEVELISVASDGTQANRMTHNSAEVSNDGRYVVFNTDADNLVPGDVLGTSFNDVFVRDRAMGKTYQASVTRNGLPADGDSGGPSMSADGRFITFASNAINIVPNDTNCSTDIFVVEVASLINSIPPAPTGDTPVAVTDTADVILGSSTVIDVLANDYGLGDAPITIDIACPPSIGTVTVNADNTITYDLPANSDNAADEFRYRITDTDGDQFSAMVRPQPQLGSGGGSGGGTGGGTGGTTSNFAASGGGGFLTPACLLFLACTYFQRRRKKTSCYRQKGNGRICQLMCSAGHISRRVCKQ